MSELPYGQDVKATEENTEMGFRYGMHLGPIFSWRHEPTYSFLTCIEARGRCKVTNAQMEGWVTFDKPVSADILQYAFDRHLAVSSETATNV